jgi:ketosteroid isomerase-like protein
MDNQLTREITMQEDQLTAATRQLDLDTLDRIYADDILFTGVTGATCGKSSLMDEARRGKAERQAAAETKHAVVSYDKEDMKVVSHGETAVASWRFVITIHNHGQETKRAYRTTNVWMKRPAGWQVIAGHTSMLDAVPAN